MTNSTLTSPPKSRKTLADLWEQLGEVPLERILMDPVPGTADERDLLACLDGDDKRLCELVDGVLVEKPMGEYESRLAARIIYLFYRYLDENDIGAVFAPDGPMRLAPGQVRLPDVGFVLWRHFPSKDVGKGKVLNQPPDLAIEVLSAGNTAKEMDRKLREYFKSGASMVWYIDPRTRSARAYTSPRKYSEHGEADPLKGGKLLPGFELSLKELFARVPKIPTRG